MAVLVSGMTVQVSGMAFQASVTPFFQASSTLKTKNSTPKFILSESPKLGRFFVRNFLSEIKMSENFRFNVFCVLIELFFLSQISSIELPLHMISFRLLYFWFMTKV